MGTSTHRSIDRKYRHVSSLGECHWHRQHDRNQRIENYVIMCSYDCTDRFLILNSLFNWRISDFWRFAGNGNTVWEWFFGALEMFLSHPTKQTSDYLIRIAFKIIRVGFNSEFQERQSVAAWGKIISSVASTNDTESPVIFITSKNSSPSNSLHWVEILSARVISSTKVIVRFNDGLLRTRLDSLLTMLCSKEFSQLWFSFGITRNEEKLEAWE